VRHPASGLVANENTQEKNKRRDGGGDRIRRPAFVLPYIRIIVYGMRKLNISAAAASSPPIRSALSIDPP
jgi:hypothetical protein